MSNYSRYHADIAQWYVRHGRHHLPWRTTDDPYHIYVSEIMLQQTQVHTVLSRYYYPFLAQFPTLTALAAAQEADVLKAWEGLGYYTRARNLHKAALLCAPKLPSTVEELLALPGIGQNTAHAVAALAFRKPVAVMEANVKRVLHRLNARTTMRDAELWEDAMARVDRDDPFSYNQAMMDIGSMICLPKKPQCMLCPLSHHCAGRNDPLAYPAKKIKKAVPIRQKNIIVCENNGHYYMTPRDTKFLHGLYGFIEIDHTDHVVACEGHEHNIHDLQHIGGVVQQYSHFTLDANIYLARHHAKMKNTHHWHLLDALQELPTSRSDQKILALIHS